VRVFASLEIVGAALLRQNFDVNPFVDFAPRQPSQLDCLVALATSEAAPVILEKLPQYHQLPVLLHYYAARLVQVSTGGAPCRSSLE
jgi:hypothetical protein